jgi:hypothetical protein
MTPGHVPATRFPALSSMLYHSILKLRTSLLWVLESILVIVWVTTVASLFANGQAAHLGYAIAIVVSLYVLFFAEGLELAVADLLDKHPEQLGDARLQRLLQELQQCRDFFFGTRQVFVVLIISFMSLKTAYPWIFIPFIGQVSKHEALFWFSLTFTSLTVLWFCQVTPKRLAVMNSQLFLRQSAFLWPIIKLVGLLGLPNPSDQLVHLFERFTSYRQKRHLRPSPAAHYNSTSQIYGSALDRLHVEITVGDRRAATVRKRFAALFLHGSRAEHSGKMYSASGFSNSPAVKVVGLFTGAVPERLETIHADLDVIFSGQSAPASSTFTAIKDWPHRIESLLETDLLRGGQWAKWMIRSFRPLPEAFWPRDERAEPLSMPLVLLVYEVEFELAEGALTSRQSQQGEEHVWPEYIDVPCRLYSFAARPLRSADSVALQGCDVRLLSGDIALPEETARCSWRAISAHDCQLELRYPLQGSVYSVRWWHNSTESAGGSIAEVPMAPRVTDSDREEKPDTRHPASSSMNVNGEHISRPQ